MTRSSKKRHTPSIRLSFYGAAKTVTGSKYLVEVDKRKILVDCGLFQGKKALRLKNWEEPPFEARELSAIVLTHAHVDHSGYLPLLVRRGYHGPIYCTPPTKDLLELLLPDSAHLQEEQARYANKHGISKHKPAKPLFTQKDARETLRLLRVFERNQNVELFPQIAVHARCAGHILGSTCLNLDMYGKRITFSGDLGRYDSPILPDPQSMELGDVLLCESTYGNRQHPESEIKKQLTAVITQAVERRGAVLIPAFAIGRTQNLLYYLADLERKGDIPTLPVFVDSPMAVNATNIYRSYRHDYDEEAAELLRAGETPLMTERTGLCRSVKESKLLNSLKGPRVIISASGMATGGRVLHHLKYLLPQEEATILFVGYQAEGTRGRRIQSGEEEIKLFGQKIPVRAKVETVSGLSAHGDRDELTRWLKNGSHTPKHVRVVHGEENASEEFATHIRSTFNWNTEVAEYAETMEF